MKQMITRVVLCALVSNIGVPAIAQAQSPTVAGEFVSKLPVGTITKLRLDDGRRIKATLIAIEDEAVVVKLNTRLPEPPLRIELNRIVDADIERGANFGRAVAAGAAAGAGAALGVFFLLVAIYSD
jgi:hypothetical protein